MSFWARAGYLPPTQVPSRELNLPQARRQKLNVGYAWVGVDAQVVSAVGVAVVAAVSARPLSWIRTRHVAGAALWIRRSGFYFAVPEQGSIPSAVPTDVA